MARYERLGGDDEGGSDGGGGGAPSLKRNLLVVVLALALFATVLGNFFSTVLVKLPTYIYIGSKRILSSLHFDTHTITGPHLLFYFHSAEHHSVTLVSIQCN